MISNKNLQLELGLRDSRKVWIQRLAGGLGNEIMEYVFLRFMERRQPEITWFLDDLFYYAYGYEYYLTMFERVFSVKLKKVSRYYSQDTFEEVVRLYRKGVYLPQLLLNRGVPVVTVSDWKPDPFKGITIEKPWGYFPKIMNLPYRYVYSVCLYNDKCWFMQDRAENLAELSFPPLQDTENLEYADQIQSHMSVGIHIRRGDFLQSGWDFGENVYRKGCELAVQKYPDAWFFVFSDGLEWCKSHAKELGLNLAKHTVYVSGNEAPDKNYIDMQLLSLCKGMIRLGLSTFSGVASWLDQNLIFEIIIGAFHEYQPHPEVRFFERKA